MKLKSTPVTLLLLCAVCSTLPLTGSAQITNNPVPPVVITNLTGSWQNELKSVLTISDVDAKTGAIVGHYLSPSGTGGDAFPLCGWVNTKAPSTNHPNSVIVLSFTVRWGAIGSITTWNGYHTVTADGRGVIIGQWLLARPNSDFIWDHILTGQDRFERRAANQDRNR